MFLNANNTQAPGIVDADRQPIIDRKEVYSGCFGRASISFYAFNTNGNKGIACSLNNLQKIKDGEHLEPVGINVETFGTEHKSIAEIEAFVRSNYELTPKGIIKSLHLLDVDYNKVSAYGHFGKRELPWEQ